MDAFWQMNPQEGRRTQMLKRFFREESGASMTEYGLLVALIAVVAISAVTALGENITSKFQDVANRIAAAGPM
jgi:pilus assembly protein Flp/PilA